MTDAKELTIALCGRWHGRYGAAPCPVCQPEGRKGQNALTLADGISGRLVLDCKKSACAFLDILAAAGMRSGDYTPPDAATLARRKAEQRAEAAKRAEQAKRLWREARPIAGTLAETYLRGRGITAPLPATLRFHPECWHGPTARRLPFTNCLPVCYLMVIEGVNRLKLTSRISVQWPNTKTFNGFSKHLPR